MPVLFSTTTTAQTILNSVAQDVRQTLSATDPTNGQGTLLDYVSRVSLEMLRASRWVFLLSPIQQFYTQLGVTNYWVGSTGGAPPGAYDTGLNIANLRIVKPKSVYDYSNFTALGHVDEQPLAARLFYPDGTPRPGRPSMWRQDESTPNVLNIYPAPDNQNIYSPMPLPVFATYGPGGTLPARLYYLSATFVDSLGNESTAPALSEFFVPANNLITVYPPQEPVGMGTTGVKYNRWNVYAASAGTSETNQIQLDDTTQQASLISTGTTWTEPSTGLTTTGQNPPGDNNVQPITGYLMNFRYYAQRTPVTTLPQILQVPDDYRDVCIAGVNALAYSFLTRPQDAQKWYAIYKDGITQMVRDINFMAKGGEYIQPDAATIGSYLPAVETVDLSYLTT
jgi:hypothetical protein